MSEKNRNEYHKDYLGKTRVTAYVKSRYQRLITAYSYDKDQTRSATFGIIIKDFFEGMSEAEKQKYFEIYERLTPEERKKPSKNSY